MCEYCENEKPLFEASKPTGELHGFKIPDDEMEISIYKDLLVCDVDGFGTRSLRINCCPMCGRNLKEQSNEL